MVTPSLFNSVKISMISSPCLELRLPVGSSAKINFGFTIKALAIPTNCCCPPERLFGNKSFFPTICFTTEAVARSKHFALSYKLSVGGSFRKDNINYLPNPSRNGEPFKAPGFFGQTINYTRDKGWSIYDQLTFASHAVFFQLGFIIQLRHLKNLK